ncbi:unnamed protein product [Calypogeia fissa]
MSALCCISSGYALAHTPVVVPRNISSSHGSNKKQSSLQLLPGGGGRDGGSSLQSSIAHKGNSSAKGAPRPVELELDRIVAARAAGAVRCSVSVSASSASIASNVSVPASSGHSVVGLGNSFGKDFTRNYSTMGARRRVEMERTTLAAASMSASGVFDGSSLGLGDVFGNEGFGALGGGANATQAPAMAQRSAEADVMGLLLKQRIVVLGHQMDDFVADGIISQLLLLDAVDPSKDIRLFVNCPGGSISAAMGIYDSIQLCRADVSTVAFGLAASTAAIVLAGGSKGKRFAMPNARIMMHQPLGGASGQAIDVEIQAKEVMYHKNNITRIISEITGRPFDQVSKDMDRDRYMSPVEAIEYGLIDFVIDEDSIIALAPTVERVKPRSLNIVDDPVKFLNPDIPDDEIY